LDFKLDQRLKKDTFLIGELPLSRVLLMNVSNFPWAILVPKISGISELHELDFKQQIIYQAECNYISKHMSQIYGAHKMNIASLGNLVPQLHTHVIVRYKDDDAWPGPVWTFQNMLPYSDDESKLQIDKITKLVDYYEQGENYE
jgi:diadenosine tetraphosphate (Ap4A) HIT family hydrolase